MSDRYTECLSEHSASMILGDKYESDCTYHLVSLPDKFVINKKNKIIGTEEEIILEETEMEWPEYMDRQLCNPVQDEKEKIIKYRIVTGIMLFIIFVGLAVTVLAVNGSLRFL